MDAYSATSLMGSFITRHENMYMYIFIKNVIIK